MKSIMDAFPVLFLLFSVFFSYISINILIKKRPVVINSKILNIIIILGYFPSIFFNLAMIDLSKSLSIINIIISFMLLLSIVFYLFIIKGYSIYGVNDEDFRDSVIFGLKKLSIEFHEKMNKIELTNTQNEINIAFQSWMGTGMIKLKNKKDIEMFKKLKNEIVDYFSQNNVSIKKVTGVFYLIFGVLFLILTTAFLYL